MSQDSFMDRCDTTNIDDNIKKELSRLKDEATSAKVLYLQKELEYWNKRSLLNERKIQQSELLRTKMQQKWSTMEIRMEQYDYFLNLKQQEERLFTSNLSTDMMEKYVIDKTRKVLNKELHLTKIGESDLLSWEHMPWTVINTSKMQADGVKFKKTKIEMQGTMDHTADTTDTSRKGEYGRKIETRPSSDKSFEKRSEEFETDTSVFDLILDEDLAQTTSARGAQAEKGPSTPVKKKHRQCLLHQKPSLVLMLIIKHINFKYQLKQL